MMPVLFHRTLLALGCHVGMGDEKAEENLKKIKLPKTYGSKRYLYTSFILCVLCKSQYDSICPLAM